MPIIAPASPHRLRPRHYSPCILLLASAWSGAERGGANSRLLTLCLQPMGGLARVKSGQHAEYPSETVTLEPGHARQHQKKPLSAFGDEMRHLSAELRKQGQPSLRDEELISARLCTCYELDLACPVPCLPCTKWSARMMCASRSRRHGAALHQVQQCVERDGSECAADDGEGLRVAVPRQHIHYDATLHQLVHPQVVQIVTSGHGLPWAQEWRATF